ncbi:hypothetical protein RJT34_09509 [Clitoria ternatea]|uniref:BZIP domain-containing protein n=1 Tax=Clitoria ternatea TaxID=43366 RepID=A0AAN9K6Y8_CLITE
MDPTCSPFNSFKYPSPMLQFFPFPLPSSLRFTLLNSPVFSPLFLVLLSHLSQAMFLHEAEAVQVPCPPVLKTTLTESEILDLFSHINQSVDPASPGSGSQGSNRAVYSSEERKMRRMQSNRESARRSRFRKKKHLENLTSELNRLKIENRELKNRVALTMHHHLLLSLQIEHLQSESLSLMATLSDLRQPCFHNNTPWLPTHSL